MIECSVTLLDALIDADYCGREPFDCEHPEHWATVDLERVLAPPSAEGEQFNR